MSSAAVAALRVEILSAIRVIEPQLRGLQDLSRVSLSEPVMEYIGRDITTYSLRYSLMKKVIDALDSLEANGYPDMGKIGLPGDLYSELMQERDDLIAAIGEFEGLVAANISVDLGEIADKPEEN